MTCEPRRGCPLSPVKPTRASRKKDRKTRRMEKPAQTVTSQMTSRENLREPAMRDVNIQNPGSIQTHKHADLREHCF